MRLDPPSGDRFNLNFETPNSVQLSFNLELLGRAIDAAHL
jgi:hypothetical protein